MNCPHCQAPLLIEHAHCPYCGTENPYFKQHRADMENFQSEFEETKQQVRAEVVRSSHFTAKIVAVCVLITLNVILFFMHFRSWDLQRTYLNYMANANSTTHTAALSQYLENRDYIGFETYYDDNNLYVSDAIDHYTAIHRAASQYGYIYNALMDLTLCSENSYRTPEKTAEYIWESLDAFYNYITPGEYDDPSRYTEEHCETLLDMQDQLHALFACYLGLSADEIAALPTMSDAARGMTIEKGVLANVHTQDETNG